MAATYDNSVDYTEESVRKIIVSRGFEPRKLSVEDLCSKVMFIRRARSLPENVSVFITKK